MVLLVVEDLIFLSRIQQTAQAVGTEVESVDTRQIEDRAAQGGVRAIIIDLNHCSCSAVETVRTLKRNPATRQLPVVGFLSHVQTDLAAAAREAGCDLVLARSAFVRQLPQLLRKLSGQGMNATLSS